MVVKQQNILQHSIKRFNLEDTTDTSADDLLGANQGGIDPADDDAKPDNEDDKDKDKSANPDPADKSPDINKGGDDSGDADPKALEEFTNNLKTILTPLNEADLTEDDKAVREDLLSEFKGSRFSSNGDILDKDGKILKSFDEVAKYLNEQEDVSFDDKGNQVDKDGNILATKEELELANNDVNKKAKKWGYEFTDETGKPRVYPPGEEGEKALIADIVQYQNEQFQEEFLNTNPVLREVAKHLLAGGDIKDFEKPVDYTGVDIKPLTKEQKVGYIKQSLIAEGVNADRAGKIAATYKDSELDAETKAALDILQDKEVEKEQKRSQLLEQKQIEEAKETDKYWNGVNEIISKGDLKGFTIPEKDRSEFFKYLAVPVKDGMSQDQIDRQSNPIETSLKEAFFRWKKYDVGHIVKENVGVSRAAQIKMRVQKREELASHKSNSSKDSRKVDISLENIQ